MADTRKIRFEDFSNGLWVAGAPDTVPKGYLRRARGIHSVYNANIRSRDGDSTLYSLAAHTLYRYDDARYQAADASLYKDNVLVLTGLSGNHVSFVRMPPTTGTKDYLFLVDGVTPQKLSPGGVVSQWGIDAPPDGFTATIDALKTKVIDSLDVHAANYTPANCTLANEGSIKQVGTGSLKMTISGGDTTGFASAPLGVDLTSFADLTASALEDRIDLWVYIDNAANVEYIGLRFDFTGTGFNTNYATYKCLISNDTPDSTASGTGDVAGFDAPSTAHDEGQGSGGIVGADSTGSVRTAALNEVNVTSTFIVSKTWRNIRVSKSFFLHDAATAANTDWNAVLGIQLFAKTNGNGGATVYWDAIQLSGGVGTSGAYKYQVTFRNSVTGSRSNANPTAVEVKDIDRQSITLHSLPVSTNPGVDQREIWRTIGNGARLYRCLVISDNTTTTIVDHVSDYAGMRTNVGDTSLESTELPIDNDPPEAGFARAWGPWQGRIWWCGNTADGTQGLVYYSPAGRAEAVQGFIRVSNNDEPTQTGVLWNGSNYVLTEAWLYIISNTTEPFLSKTVLGSPGTGQPNTVMSTPYGIAYQAIDTIRLFNGLASTPLNPDAMLSVLRGTASENLTGFIGTVATYARDEYIISDGTQTLACNLRTKQWRDLGFGCTALYTEADTGEIIATVGGVVKRLEVRAAQGNGVAFEVRTGAVNFGNVPTVLERVIVNSHTETDSLTAAIELDAVEYPLGLVAHPYRATDVFTVGKMCMLANVNLAGTLQQHVEVYSVELEVREVPLYILTNGKFLIHALYNTVLSVGGEVLDISQGISYYGIDAAIAYINLKWVPEIRRLYLDVNTHGLPLTPVLTLYNSTVTLPPIYTDTRRLIEWDINLPDRLIAIELQGNFRDIQIYQAGLDIQMGEEL